MKRLTKQEKERIYSLTKKGKSLNFISKSLNKSKTTIYHHTRKLIGRKIKKVKIDLTNEELLGEFLGVFAGDGYMIKTKNYNYRIILVFNIKEAKYVFKLKKILMNLFNKEPLIFKRPGNIIILSYCSKEIQNLIKQYLFWNIKRKGRGKKSRSIQLKTNLLYSPQFKIGFLRGNLDTDGYYSNQKILFGTTSPKLANTIFQFLKDLNINPSHYVYKEKRKNRANLHHIYVKKEERDKFLNMIKPKNLISVR